MQSEGTILCRIFLIAVAVFIAFVDFPEALAAPEGQVKIAILISHREDPYGAVVSGFHKSLSGQKFIPHYYTYSLGGFEANLARTLREIKKVKPDLILVLGSFALGETIREITDIPIVAGMFLRSDELKKAQNATGVYLEFPLHTQFRWLARILPYARTVGVLYNPAENRKRIDAADRTAEIYGFRLMALPVKAPRDIPEALENLSKSANVVWGVNDMVALTPETARNVFLFSFRTRIPFVGLSASWVKAGALYALEWDYTDMGAQCGEMAATILKGGGVAKIPPAPPRKAILALNLKTAKQMGVEIPDWIVSAAGQVFGGAD